MGNIRFLSQAWFKKTIANNLQLLSEITATAACGIWLQPQKTSNQLWVSASFFKFLGLELNATSAEVQDLKKNYWSYTEWGESKVWTSRDSPAEDLYV